MHLMFVLAALHPTADATPTYFSDPQHLVFFDEVPVFDVLEVDTGYLPGGLSPASVRFFIAPWGGVTTEVEATSYLAWPDPLLHNVRGNEGTGHFVLDGGIDLQAEVFIDLGFLFSATIPLWTESIFFSDQRNFDPLLLDETTVRVSGDTEIFPSLEFPLPIIDGLDLFLVADLFPDVSAVLDPVGVLTYADDGSFTEQLDEDESMLLAVPADPAEIVLLSSYVADVTSTMDVVLEASIELQTFLGPFTVYTLPLPLTLVDTDERRISEPSEYAHPLPAISDIPEVLDFGVLSVGESSSLAIDVENIGLRALGTAATLDGGPFAVRPASALLQPGDAGAYTVTFTASAAGPVVSTLVLETSDPSFPWIEVTLLADVLEADTTTTTGTGTGTGGPGTGPTGGTAGGDDPGTDPGPGIGDISDSLPRWVPDDEEGVRFGRCGCATSAPAGGVWLVLLAGLVARRR
ncbi:MAG: hypothetical protein ACI8PZ_003630 [Myxococcota bacterium]|jgi:hypothetical protein